ncbi:MAG: ABC transporter permease [Actinomycetota bacterium]|nr:ABC transporter permease [Actinomycetota bacterium]
MTPPSTASSDATPSLGSSGATPSGAADRRAASPGRRIGAQARFETGGLLRHGEQLLVSLVLPLLALAALAASSTPSLGDGRRIDLATAGVLALAVISTAFTGQAILLAYERRYGVLRLLGTTPLGRSGLLAAKAASVLVVLAIQAVVLGGVGLALGWRPEPTGIPAALLVGVVGAWAFASLAALLGGTLRAEGVLAVANLLWVLVLAVGGVVLAADRFPAPWGELVAWLPSAALGDGLRSALIEGALPVSELLILLAWAAVGSTLAARLLRWSD